MAVTLIAVESEAAIMSLELEEELTLLVGETTIVHDGGDVDNYLGPYEFTPTESTQTIEINGLKATDDITINPIPSCYGLITWNGSTITVS